MSDDNSKDVEQTPGVAGKPMSSSLKERLRRSARSCSSPLNRNASIPVTKSFPLSNPEMSLSDFSKSSSPFMPLASQFISPNTNKSKVISSEVLALVEKNEITALAQKNSSLSEEDIKMCTDKTNLEVINVDLKKEIAINEEKLRKLKLVRQYRLKYNPAEFTSLIEKWKKVAQDALRKLQQIHPEPKPTFRQILDFLQIDYKVMGYDPENDVYIN